MRRRELVLLLVGAMVARPLTARAQQPAIPVIGFLHSASAANFADLMPAFHKGVERYWLRRRSECGDRISLGGRTQRAAAGAGGRSGPQTSGCHRDTDQHCRGGRGQGGDRDDPIVFAIGADPVKTGLVASLNRPGGNATGVGDIGVELGAKRLGLLHELLPGAARFAALVNPDNPLITGPFITEVESAAATIGRQVEIVTARTTGDIDVAFTTFARIRVDGFLISPEALFVANRGQIIALAARHGLPAMYHRREFVDAGGLMSYGSSLAGQFRQTGVYAGRILKGANPADLPVQLPTRFELAINLKTAKALGLTISPLLLAEADAVIE
jgi:putative ABC transport system substrate-binding protein